MPTEDNDKLLLMAARGFATNALPLLSLFIMHEMSPEFLDDLNADIAALETAIAAQGNAVGDHVAAGAAIEDAIDRGIEIVRKLRSPVLNKYENNAAALAEWTSASHTERAPRHAPRKRQLRRRQHSAGSNSLWSAATCRCFGLWRPAAALQNAVEWRLAALVAASTSREAAADNSPGREPGDHRQKRFQSRL